MMRIASVFCFAILAFAAAPSAFGGVQAQDISANAEAFDVMLAMPDGTRLYTYGIRPAPGVKCPIVVTRNPYQKERKIMCGPVDAVKAQSEKYFVIIPGRGKAGRTAALMAKELDVPEEEVSRILPPGKPETRRIFRGTAFFLQVRQFADVFMII